MFVRISSIVFAFLLFFTSQNVSAELVINEIMYNLPGADTGREWVEIANIGTTDVTVATTSWKFFEANTNHSLSLFRGSTTIPTGGFAIIADDPSKFIIDWPQFVGTIFDSVFSLSNSGEFLALKSSTTTVVDQLTYSSATGAAGDGTSLQKVSGVWVALTPSPGLANQSGSVSTSTNTQGSNSSTTTATTTSAGDNASEMPAISSSEGKTNWPVEPQVFSRIVGPATAIAGADVVFKGEAVGIERKPLENPRYLWNFGDGATKEGESVMHTYNFPGDYVVILEASSGKFSGTSRLKIRVVPADIVVQEVVSGPDGKIEILNDSNQELDLSWWHVSSGGKFFTLPKNTKVLAHGRIPLSAAVMGFAVDDSDVSLLYPNGSLAYKFEKETETPPVVAVPEKQTPLKEKESVEAAVLPETPAPPVQEPISKISEPSRALAQTASVALGAGSESDMEGSADVSVERSTSLWFYGLGGVIILGLGFTLMPRLRPTEPTELKNVADEYEIIE